MVGFANRTAERHTPSRKSFYVGLLCVPGDCIAISLGESRKRGDAWCKFCWRCKHGISKAHLERSRMVVRRLVFEWDMLVVLKWLNSFWLQWRDLAAIKCRVPRCAVIIQLGILCWHFVSPRRRANIDSFEIHNARLDSKHVLTR